MLLLKNPQFLRNHNETWSKCGTHGLFIFTKFCNDCIKIVDFLIKAYFWIFLKFGATNCTPYLPIPPSMHMYSPGPWSDRHGRKLLILIPILGQVLTCTTFILNVVLFDLLPFEALYMEYINELRQRMFRFELKFKKKHQTPQEKPRKFKPIKYIWLLGQ